MTYLTRNHTGIECSINKKEDAKWAILIKYNLKGQTPSAMLIARELTLDEARAIADDEVSKSGHVCDAGCQDWKVLESR